VLLHESAKTADAASVFGHSLRCVTLTFKISLEFAWIIAKCIVNFLGDSTWPSCNERVRLHSSFTLQQRPVAHNAQQFAPHPISADLERESYKVYAAKRRQFTRVSEGNRNRRGIILMSALR
jgi:hypothetical protein